MDMKFRNLEEFWPFYITQHSKAATRRWHLLGLLLSLICLFFSYLLLNPWLLVLAPVPGYVLSWYSHYFIELNTPSNFGHPFWSMFCYFKMCGLMLVGQMDHEISQLGMKP